MQIGKGGVQSTLFCIFNNCYFISSPNKLNICHIIKQLYIHNENNALQKKFYNQLKKGAFSVECAPCLGHTRHKHGVHLTGQKSWVTCIAQCSCDIPCKVGTCWLPLHFFHILITHYHCMAKQIWWLPNIQWNQCSMMKSMLYHTNIMCLWAHNRPKNAHRLELLCTAFQYNPSTFTLFRLA